MASLAATLTGDHRIARWQPRLTTGQRRAAALQLPAPAARLTIATIVTIFAALVHHALSRGSAEALATAAMVGVAGLVAGATWAAAALVVIGIVPGAAP